MSVAAAGGSGSSSSSAEMDPAEKVQVMKKAEDLMAQGKRNMVCGEVPKAVNLFEEAVKLLVENYGEMSRDCADAYFHCGSALLELCRMESSVLGSALDGVEVEEEKEEKESDQFEKPPKDDADTEKPDEGGAEETEDDGTEGAEDDEGAEDENEGADAEEKDADDVSHFQLAWEYLDVAKVIFSKKEEKDDQLKSADCLIKLGELSMENEQHDTAAADLESALTIQKKYLEKDDRSIAETHYQLGLAYGLAKEFEKAIEQYQQAIEVIEAKVVSLTKLIEEKEIDADDKENCATDALGKHKEEIKELQELIPEMRNKIEDTRVEQKDLEKMKEIAKQMLGLSGTTKGFGSPTKKTEAGAAGGSSGSSSKADVDENGEKKAASIGHLVRKKRKPEDDDTSSTASELKKARQEDGSGDLKSTIKVNGQMNGHISPEKKSDAPAAAEPMAS